MHVPESIEKCLEQQEEEQRIEIAQLKLKAERLARELGRLVVELDGGQRPSRLVAASDAGEIDCLVRTIQERTETVLILRALSARQCDSVAQNATNLSREGEVEGQA